MGRFQHHQMRKMAGLSYPEEPLSSIPCPVHRRVHIRRTMSLSSPCVTLIPSCTWKVGSSIFPSTVGVLCFFCRAKTSNWALHDDCLELHHPHFACISQRISTAYDGSDARSIVGDTVAHRSG